MRTALQLVVLVLAAMLTLANSAAPGVSFVTEPDMPEGAVPIEVERRVYHDRPLLITLPPGTYSRVRVLRLTPEPQRDAEAPTGEPGAPPLPVVVVELAAGAPELRPVLEGDPITIELVDDGERHRGEDVRYRVEVERTDGARGALEFTITSVIQ